MPPTPPRSAVRVPAEHRPDRRRRVTRCEMADRVGDAAALEQRVDAQLAAMVQLLAGRGACTTTATAPSPTATSSSKFGALPARALRGGLR